MQRNKDKGIGRVNNWGEIVEEKLEREKSKIDTYDGWDRTFYGSPTIDGFIVVGVIILYLIFK